MLFPPTEPQIMIALKRYKSFAQDLYGFEHLYEMGDIDIKITLTHRMLCPLAWNHTGLPEI